MIDNEMIEEIVDQTDDLMEQDEETGASGPKPMDQDQIESIAREAVSDALDFIESEISRPHQGTALL